MSDDVLQAFTPAEARSFWDDRHRAAGDLASGGNIGYSTASNAMLYAVRAARLIECTAPWQGREDPLRVLDAGCGKGWFSRAMAGFGHRVDGIDSSVFAIEQCREAAGPMESYAVSELASWAPPHLYDVVYCIDVLYHLLDDEEWERSVRHLCSLVGVGGRVLLVDHDAVTDRLWSKYQLTRGTGRYEALLAECGLTYERFVPNNFRHDPSGFHVAARRSA